MRRIIFLLLFILVGLVAKSQLRPAGIASPNSTGYGKIGYQQADSGFIQQPRDTFPAKYPTLIRWSGDNTFWQTMGNGARWFPLASGSLRAIYAGYGLTKINDSTLGVDTGLIATRARVQKAVDSLGVVKQPYNANTTILGNTTTGSGGTIVLSGSPSLTLPSFTGVQVSGGIASMPTGSGTLAYTSALTPYKLVSDTLFNGGYTTRNTTKKIADSLAALISGGGFGTVQSVSTTDGVGIVSSVASPTANPNISIRVDTNTIATRLRVQKGIDSLGVLITTGDAAKLNISDTAAMLTPNYRRTITKITNSDLVNSTISGTALGSNLPALSFGTYLQASATSYNGTTANTISTNATSSNTGSTLVARDVNGDFAARNITANLSGNASSASTVTVTNDNTTNATMYPLWSSASSGNNSAKTSSSKITFNPSTGVLSSSFSGSLAGNATTASTLQTARTINGVPFDGSADISISASVDSSLSAGYGITGSPFNGSLGRTWVVDTTKIVPYTDTLASYGMATKSFVRSFGYGTGSVTSVATNNGSGISGGTITTTGTIAADTVILATRPRVQKGIDSLGGVITSGLALKVNISDTASMLTNYRTGIIALNADTATLAARFTNQTNLANSKVAISDTATMLSGYKTYYPRAALSAGTGISYNASTGVITNSSPSSGGTVTSVATDATMQGGTITTSGTLKVDTVVMATRLRVQKGIDSLGQIVSTKGSGTVTSVATNTGSGITGGTITSTGTIAADTTVLSTKANVTALLLGKVSSVSGTSPISSSGGATPTISISQATTSTNGYLSSTDWNTFNNKQPSFTQGISGYIPKWTSASGLDTSSIRQIGSSINMTGRLNLNGATDESAIALNVLGQGKFSNNLGVYTTSPKMYLYNTTGTEGQYELRALTGNGFDIVDIHNSTVPFKIDYNTSNILMAGALTLGSATGTGSGVFYAGEINGSTFNIGGGTAFASGGTIRGVGNNYQLTLLQNNTSTAGYGIWSTNGGVLNFTRYSGSTYSSPTMFIDLSQNLNLANRLNVNGATDNSSYQLNVNGNALATTFVKSGGTSSQYLMADGSVTTAGGGGFVPYTGATNNVALAANSLTFTTGQISLSTGAYSTNISQYQLRFTDNGTGFYNELQKRNSSGYNISYLQDKTYTLADSAYTNSGTYTPTLTNTTNISSSSLSQATYSRVGNIVHVNVAVSLTPTLSTTNTVLTIQLPQATATGTQSYIGQGTFFGNGASNLFSSGIVSIASTTTATFTFQSMALTSSNANIQFDYKIN